MNTILLIHGPNLNLLGRRNSDFYGNCSLGKLIEITAKEAQKHRLKINAFQSNHEGELIDKIQQYSEKSVGIIINAGALSHYSYSLYDALLDTNLPVVEVHLSKVSERETFRQHSVISDAAIKVIEGRKSAGYIEAVNVLANFISNKSEL